VRVCKSRLHFCTVATTMPAVSALTDHFGARQYASSHAHEADGYSATRGPDDGPAVGLLQEQDE
jgi:hypothetical protein